MKLLYGIGLLLSLLLLSGCEKGIDTGESSQGTSGVSITPDIKQSALTIAEAQKAAPGSQICVKGFIVAATTMTINNAEFSAPFNGNTALVLASKKSDGNSIQFTLDELFPICLTDASKGIKDAYNLASNPQYHNQYVYISGTRDTYMQLPGLKKVKAIEIDPNHVVTSDEEPDATDDGDYVEPGGDEGNQGGDDGDQGGDEGDPEDPQPPVIPDTPQDPIDPDTPKPSTSTILTVAEAKSTAKDHAHITVKGYIVAATGYNIREYTQFSAPFDESGYVVLADKPFDNTKSAAEQYDTVNYSDLLPVNLGTKGKKMQSELNLVSHPENQNRLIQFSGDKTWILGTYGLDEVDSYQWITP